MQAGAAYARRDPAIFKLLTIAFVAGLLGMSYMPLMPAYVGDILKMDRGSVFGWLMTAGGVGGLIGAVAITLAGDVRWKGRLLLAAVFGTGVLQLGLGALGYLQENALGPIIPVLAGLGMANAITLTMANTLLQTNVEDEYRGRVMAIYFISFSLQPLGSLAGGAIANSLGLEPSLILMGALVAAATLWIAVTSPLVRRL
jgi:MFS family permease